MVTTTTPDRNAQLARDAFAGSFAPFFSRLWSAATDNTDWFCAQVLRPPDRAPQVLDLGCGNGRLALAMARDGAQVLGVELSSEMLRRGVAARNSAPPEIARRVTLLHGDGLRLPALVGAVSTFDIVAVAGLTMPLLSPEDRRLLWRRAAQWLRPGGLLLLDWLAVAPDDVPDSFSATFPVTGTAGKSVRLRCDRDPQARQQVTRLVWDADGRATEESATLTCHLLAPDELASEVRTAGLRRVRDDCAVADQEGGGAAWPVNMTVLRNEGQ